jgi:phage terminase large subunit
MVIKLTNCIGEKYYDVFNDMEKYEHLHYWFKGGRGSLKSSFACIYTIYSLTQDYLNGEITHCVALRKVKDTIKDSIFNNLLWAIELLGVNDLWHNTQSPMKLWIGENKIVFRGCANKDEFEKIKSIKFKKGAIKFALFEELTEFNGVDEITSIIQSIFRGTDRAIAMYMYNPPASKNNWVNIESKIVRKDRYVHHSTYLDVNPRWLGKVFIDEAETIKEINPRKYNHMYLAEEIGEGLEIYPNIEIRTITDDEILSFEKVDRGLDFGFTIDASSYVECYFNERKDWLYIFDNIYGHGLTNQTLANKIKPKSKNYLIYGDSAEPRTINELNLLGLNIRGAKKGKDSKPHGIKWLQAIAKIIIDRKRTPDVVHDFECYEYLKDKNGNIIYEYPKEPHSSAAVRYALNEKILSQRLVFA